MTASLEDRFPPDSDEGLEFEAPFGAIWRARSAEGQPVRVVRLLTREEGGATETDAEHFLERAAELAGLAPTTKGLPSLLAHERDEEGAYAVFADVEGRDFEAWLAEGHTRREVVELFEAFLETLEGAHGKQLVHGDLEPGNLIVDPSERMWIQGFLINRVFAEEGDDEHARRSRKFRAPEFDGIDKSEAAEHFEDPRTDLYAIGALLHRALTGRVPLRPEPNVRQVAPELPRLLALVIERALSANVNDRYSSAWALKKALRSATLASREALDQPLPLPLPLDQASAPPPEPMEDGDGETSVSEVEAEGTTAMKKPAYVPPPVTALSELPKDLSVRATNIVQEANEVVAREAAAKKQARSKIEHELEVDESGVDSGEKTTSVDLGEDESDSSAALDKPSTKVLDVGELEPVPTAASVIVETEDELVELDNADLDSIPPAPTPPKAPPKPIASRPPPKGPESGLAFDLGAPMAPPMSTTPPPAQGSSRTWQLISVALLAIVIGGAIAVFTGSDPVAPPTAANPPAGTPPTAADTHADPNGRFQVEVVGVPLTAEVLVDGERVPFHDGRLELAPGEHAIEVDVPGHAPWRDTVEITADDRLTVVLAAAEPEEDEAAEQAEAAADEPTEPEEALPATEEPPAMVAVARMRATMRASTMTTAMRVTMTTRMRTTMRRSTMIARDPGF